MVTSTSAGRSTGVGTSGICWGFEIASETGMTGSGTGVDIAALAPLGASTFPLCAGRTVLAAAAAGVDGRTLEALAGLGMELCINGLPESVRSVFMRIGGREIEGLARAGLLKVGGDAVD